MKITIILFSAFIILILASTCYYDSQEFLFPQINQTCDTLDTIPYARVDTVFHNYFCMDCHNGSNSISGLDLSDYATVNSLATHKRNGISILQGAIRRWPDFLPMPEPPRPPMDTCGMRIIELWIEQGARPPQ
jgi:hypothetical protein